jgi:predicted transcriptional regulator
VPAVDIVNTVSSRQPVLESLQAEPKDKRALVDELELSRSTIDRSIRELEMQGLVEYGDGALIVTPVGQLAIDGLSELTDTIEIGQRLEEFLEWMPMDEFGVDIRLLADADIVVAEPGDPWSMINQHIQLLKTMDEGRFLLPITGMHAAETAHERVVENEAGFELVVEPSVAETHQADPNYAPIMEEIVATGRVDVYQYERELPYGLALVGGTVQVITAEGDEPRALLETENDEVRDWAEGKYEEYRQQSQKLT